MRDAAGALRGRAELTSACVGRELERGAIRARLEASAVRNGGSIFLWGPPGIGKSALLRCARDEVRPPWRTLWVAGWEAEQALPFAALERLLHPLRDRFAGLTRHHAAALKRASGLAAPQDTTPMVVAHAALSLLSDVASDGPLACFVDDAHWLDRETLDSLGFVARRIDAEPIAIVAASRDAREASVLSAEPLALDGLAQEGAHALVEALSGTVVAPSVAAWIHRETGGNPLLLEEIARELTDDQLRGTRALPPSAPVPERMRSAVGSSLAVLPTPERRLLLLLAADDASDEATVADAARRFGAVSEVTPALRDSHLLDSADKLAFRHPALRAAAYSTASDSERRAAHSALAESFRAAGRSERAAWHAAAAVVGTDERIADELVRTAEEAIRRGGYTAAAMAVERAAELTPDARDRRDRYLRSAELAWRSGAVDKALALAERIRHEDSRAAARASLLLGRIEWRRGSPSAAATSMVSAAKRVTTADPGVARELLVEASRAAWYGGDEAIAREAASALSIIASPGDLSATFEVARSALMAGEAKNASAAMRRVLDAAMQSEDPQQLLDGGVAAVYLGEERISRELYAQAVERARAVGDMAFLPHLLEFQSTALLWCGRYRAAEEAASEGRALAQEVRLPNAEARHHATLALVAAVRGADAEARRHAGAALDAAAGAGLRVTGALARWALGLLDLGLGRHADALSHFEGMRVPGTATSHRLVALYAVPDLVEAAVRSGTRVRAAAPLEDLREWERRAPTGWAAALLCRCLGLVDAANASRHFEAALRHHDKIDRPFDRARVELLHGEHLRRERRRQEARSHLREALLAFEVLGARPWADRAAAELRAAGQRVQRPGTPLDALTPQERQVAGLVAESLPTREIAAQLFLSPRTVDHHLRNAFSKLGVRSRTELARLVLTTDDARLHS